MGGARGHKHMQIKLHGMTLVKFGPLLCISKLPTKICNEIEKTKQKGHRSFVWGHDVNERKSHLIGWILLVTLMIIEQFYFSSINYFKMH